MTLNGKWGDKLEDDAEQNKQLPLNQLSEIHDKGPHAVLREELVRARVNLDQIEERLIDRQRQIEELKNERFMISRLEENIRHLKNEIDKNGQKEAERSKPKRLDLKVKRSQKFAYKGRQSLIGIGMSLAKQYSRLDVNNTETFAEFALRMKRENRPLIHFDNDTFSLMMMHRVVSYEWLFGWFVIAFVWTFMVLILRDGIQKADETGTPLGIPVFVPFEVTIGQIFGVIICVSAQTDILSSIRVWLALRYNDESDWNTIINLEGDENRTFKNWIIRIFVPLATKVCTGLVILIVNFITIVQADDIIALMMDVGALLFLRKLPDYFFLLAQYGFIGQLFENSSKDLIDHSFPDPLPISCFRNTLSLRVLLYIFFVLLLGGSCVITLQNQLSGKYFRNKYPYCDVIKEDMKLFGNGVCDGYPSILNSIVCDFDGGDCVEFNLEYPNCEVERPDEIGDGICQELYGKKIYNTKECKFDGADCCPYDESDKRRGDGICDGGMYATKNCDYDNFDCGGFLERHPNCNLDELGFLFSDDLDKVPRLGDNICESAVYNTEECNYENGDCVECNGLVRNISWTGDGICHGGYHNTEVCNMDAGDCDKFNRDYPRCESVSSKFLKEKAVSVPVIGDGICNSALYNNPECGYEDGDCVLCNLLVDDPSKIGNGMCDGGNYMSETCGFDGGDCVGCDAPRFEIGNSWCNLQYNITECGYDGGDCIVTNVFATSTCIVEYPSLIGNGYCNGGEYNTEACGWDGGDCARTTEYSRCTSTDLILLGDGTCHGFLNNENCGFDDGDCTEFNRIYPNCTAEHPGLVGNNFCDDAYNTPECGYDGGDCLIFEE